MKPRPPTTDLGASHQLGHVVSALVSAIAAAFFARAWWSMRG